MSLFSVCACSSCFSESRSPELAERPAAATGGPVGAGAAESTNAYVSALTGVRWTWPEGVTKTLKYALTQEGSIGWTTSQAAALGRAFDAFAAVADIRFERTTNVAEAHLRERMATLDPSIGGFSELPWNGKTQVETTYSTRYADFAEGNYDFLVLLHEIGHSLGLYHSFEPRGFPGTTGAWNSGPFDLSRSMFTVMAYVTGWAGATGGLAYHAATPMAFDIAALQHLYGKNTTTNAGDDVYGFAAANTARCIYDAGGTDTISYAGPNNVRISLIAATLDTSATGGGDVSYMLDRNGRMTGTAFTIANGVVIENASAGSGDDVLLGNAAANELKGNGGNDLIDGGAGDDTIAGEAGDDSMAGEIGNDSLAGGIGNDAYFWTRGHGDDTITEATAEGWDTLVLWGGVLPGDVTVTRVGADIRITVAAKDGVPGGSILLRNQTAGDWAGIEGIRFDDGTFWDWFKLRELGSTIRGTDNGETLTGSTLGGWVDEWIHAQGGNDVVVAGTGADQVFGEAGNDTLSGDAGDDVLVGGANDDVLSGGTGADTFVFLAGDGRDRITDFGLAEGDRIALSTAIAADFATVSARAVQSGADTVLKFDGGTEITLVNVQKSMLTAEHFGFF